MERFEVSGNQQKEQERKEPLGVNSLQGLDSNHEIMPKRKRKSGTNSCTNVGRGRMVQNGNGLH
jgi:hypothetical protein